MIDITGLAIALTTTSAVGAGFNIFQHGKNKQLQEQLQRQQKELLILEGVTILSVVTAYIEQQIWKKKFLKQTVDFDNRLAKVELAIDYCNDRVNGINVESCVAGMESTQKALNDVVDALNKKVNTSDDE